MSRRRNKKARTSPSLHEMRPDSAGIDVGATEMYVAVPADRDPDSVRCFGVFTEDLHAIAKWLKSCRIITVAMESTGVYWIPLFQVLESYGLEVYLVNARHVKNVPGRKTDVLDCQWLQYLHSVGLLNSSFRPAQEICVIRSLLRHRDDMVKSASAHVQHMQKSLNQMNLQLHHVVRDITGVTGLAIIDSILAGEHNPHELAKLRDRRIKADAQTIAKSLVGDYRPEHLFTLKQALTSYRHFQAQIQECDKEVERYLCEFASRVEPDNNATSGSDTPSPSSTSRVEPDNKASSGSETPSPSSTSRFEPDENPSSGADAPTPPSKDAPAFDLTEHLHRVLGTDLTLVPSIGALTANVVFSEIGPDLSSFPTSEQFCSWLHLCPNNKITGGRIISSRTGKSGNRIAQALRMSAQGLFRSQTFLGDYARKMRSRFGAPQAITAAAHKLARIVYHLLKTQQSYDETVFAAEERKQTDRLEKKLKTLATRLGYQLVPAPAAG